MARVQGALLTGTDYERLLALVGAVGEIRDPDQFAEIVPQLVHDLVASDVTSLNDVDAQASTLRAVVCPSTFLIDPKVAEALRELSGSHPLISHMSATGDGSAIKISDFWDRRRWQNSELYSRVYAPMGVEHQMAIALPAPRPAVVGLALNRFQADFSERDRAVLNRARPHLAQSWRHAREHGRLRSLLDATAWGLHADGVGVLLLTHPIEELWPGSLGDLRRWFGYAAGPGVLPPRVQQWLESQRAIRAHRTLDSLTRPLTAVVGDRRMTVRYVPRTADHDDALLLRVTPADQLPRELAALGLSPRETEVLAILTTGASNADIADRLHLAPATVKNHLDHIYRKLGARGRVQATSIALSMLAAQRPPDA